MAHDVFVSYSSIDKPLADAVCATLEGRGIRCWVAPRDIIPGMDWSDAIIDALTSAKVFLLILSGASNQSEQVKREIQNAVGEGLPVVPLRIEDVSLSKHMRYFIGTPHWLDALTPPMELHLERLSDTIAALLHAANRHEASELISTPDSSLLGNVVAISAVAETAWDAEVLQQIERELTVFVGPMARVLVRQHSQENRDAKSLCQAVSQFLHNDTERQSFFKATNRLTSDKPQTAPSAAVDPAAPVVAWDAETLHTVERQFAEYMGPLARVLVKRMSQQVANLDALYEALSLHIQTPKERQAFLKGRQLLP